MRALLLQAAALTAAGGFLGVGVNAVRAGGLELARPVLAGAGDVAASCEAPGALPVAEVDLTTAISLRAQGAVFVDARPAGAFADGHVEGALHLPARGDAPDAAAIVERLARAPAVVVYDADGACAQARHLASWLRDRGISSPRVLLGGFPEWQERGEPAESGLCEACGARVEAP